MIATSRETSEGKADFIETLNVDVNSVCCLSAGLFCLLFFAGFNFFTPRLTNVLFECS